MALDLQPIGIASVATYDVIPFLFSYFIKQGRQSEIGNGHVLVVFCVEKGAVGDDKFNFLRASNDFGQPFWWKDLSTMSSIENEDRIVLLYLVVFC